MVPVSLEIPFKFYLYKYIIATAKSFTHLVAGIQLLHRPPKISNMTHRLGSPLIIPRHLIRGGAHFPMLAGRHEAFLLTTEYPVKIFTANLLSSPMPAEGEHMQMGVVEAASLDMETTAFVDDLVRQHTWVSNTVFSGLLRTKVLFWNCTGTCTCNYGFFISLLRGAGAFDAVVVLGAPPQEDLYWTTLGLTGNAPLVLRSDWPTVTVRWDPSLVHITAHVQYDPMYIQLSVERLLFTSTIADAFEAASAPNGH